MHPRLYRLLEKHQRVDERLRQEQRRSRPDWLRVMQLERLKLRIKDLIDRMTRKPMRI